MRRQSIELIEISALLPLIHAARRSASANPKAIATLRFMARLEDECLTLSEELEHDSYRPSAFHCFTISDPKPRQICAAAFRDRVVHHSLCAALNPRLERYAHPHSYACRVGRGTHAAIDRAQSLTRRASWALKLDVHHFFETARHDVLLDRLKRLIKGEAVLRLCERFIEHAPPHSLPGRGLPIGNLTSQHFANLYLTPLDHYITSALGEGRYVRYMDDILIFGDSREALSRIETATTRFIDHLGLKFKPSARRLISIDQGVPFLGCRLWPYRRRLDAARRRRLHRRLRDLYRAPCPSESEERLQARLTTLWSWVEKSGGVGLWGAWHERRAGDDLNAPF
jgi:RNA-directed DNA polymerase